MDFDLKTATQPTEDAMQWLVLTTAYFLLVLFLIGVIDLLIGLFELLVSGQFTDPLAVVNLLDSVLLLLIIVEVHRTLLAYVKDEPVVRIVVGAGIIAVAREIISFRINDYQSPDAALVAAGAFGVLLAVLMVAYFLIRRTEQVYGE